MIHIATVHWKTNKWIEIQLSYLKRNLKQPFLVYAFLNDLETEFEEEFYFISKEAIEDHAIKLNILADIISQNAKADDLIIFLDGDAFPVQILDNYLNAKLSDFPLIAIQRKIELGDQQPHPSFCATTVGFWKKIHGDWKMGHLWKDKLGEKVTDVGGNLLNRLEHSNVLWYPLLRTNSLSSHSLFFGVYDSIIYHNGAGFRESVSRIDHFSNNFLFRAVRYFSFILKVIASLLDKIWQGHNSSTSKASLFKSNEEVFNHILKNENFFEKKSL
ncbi:MAG: hypothetical protein ACJA2S_000052 [Cyclobacteriaceae bacterium]|jgi:hypothetical protein